MSADETQFGLKLTGVLRPQAKVDGKLRPSTGESPASEKVARPTGDTAMAPKMTEVTEAAIEPASPPLAALWRDGVRSDEVQPAQAEHLKTLEHLEDLSAAAHGHRLNRKSGHSRMLYWLMGMGSSAVIAGLLICWIYWQPLSALLVGGPVGTAPPGTVARAGSNSQPSPAAGVVVAKPGIVVDQAGGPPHAGEVPQAVPAAVPPVVAATIQPPAAPVVKPVARKQPPVSASLDLDHPFFQRIKGPFPQLFKTSTGN